jgi:predicted SAM-dependent methyltransferase
LKWEDLKVSKSFRYKQAYFTGFDPGVLLNSLRGLPTYLKDLRRYKKRNTLPSFNFKMEDAFPILTDLRSGAGTADGHYFHQDLWAARKIFQQHPIQHFDIGSRMDGFVAHLLVFMAVTVVDIRPIESDIAGLTFLQDDASELARVPDDSIGSLSTLHVAEHFGLGRYTDPIDPRACFRFMTSLQRVLAPAGRLYFSVPVGRERVEFNAHRVFAPETILNSFPELQLISFSYVGDDGRMNENTDPLALPKSEMACGMFEFTKAAVSRQD